MQYKQKKQVPYLLIANNTHYKGQEMTTRSARSISPEHSPAKPAKDGRDVVQTELSPAERMRVDDIVLRYQKYVPVRNEQRKERVRSDVSDLEILRAALLHLEKIKDDESLYMLVLSARERL